jgi:hypothetical protein
MILCSALLPSDPALILTIVSGALAGAVLPDIQMKRPRDAPARTIAWIVTRFATAICVPLMCRMYPALTGHEISPRDKRLTHSVPGILFVWGIAAGILFVPAAVLAGGRAASFSAAFLEGLMLGLVLHLAADLCTRKGIAPAFPFFTASISGSIRPCDTTDRRIAQFQIFHGSVAGIIMAYQYLDTGQEAVSVPVCIFALGSCLAMMIWSSDPAITREYTGKPVHVPPAADPFVTSWRNEHALSGLMMGVYCF